MTKELLQLLKDSKQEAMINWSKEMFVSESASQSALANAKALGGVNAVDQLIDRLESCAEGEG